jgi:hypothetical protein
VEDDTILARLPALNLERSADAIQADLILVMGETAGRPDASDQDRHEVGPDKRSRGDGRTRGVNGKR